MAYRQGSRIIYLFLNEKLCECEFQKEKLNYFKCYKSYSKDFKVWSQMILPLRGRMKFYNSVGPYLQKVFFFFFNMDWPKDLSVDIQTKIFESLG